MHSFIPKIVTKDSLKDAMLFLTDGSSNGRAIYVVNDRGCVVQMGAVSAQLVEL